MRRLISAAITTAFVAAVLLLPSAASAAGRPGATTDAGARPSIAVDFDQDYYEPSERYLADITVKNPLQERLHEVRVVFTVFRRDEKAHDLEGERLFRRTLVYKPYVDPGDTHVTLKRLARSIGRIGTFPVRADLKVGDEIVATSRSALVVLPESARPKEMLLTVIWDIHKRATFDDEGRYLDDDFENDAVDLEQLIFQPIKDLRQFPLSLAISPLFAMQLGELAGVQSDTSYITGSKMAPLPASGQGTPDIESRPALSALQSFQSKMVDPRFELLDSPMAHASIRELGERSWHSDLFQQIDRGRDVLDEVFPGLAGERRGFFAPGGEFEEGAIADLAAKNVSYAVFDSAQFPGDGPAGLQPYLVQDSESNRVTTLFSSPHASHGLARVRDGASAQLAYAEVMQAYIDQRSRDRRARLRGEQSREDANPALPPVVTLAPSIQLGQLSPEGLHRFYSALSETEWIRVVTPSEAIARYPSEDRLLLNSATEAKPDTSSRERKKYVSELADVRFNLKSLLRAAKGSERFGERLWRLVYLAEDTSWGSNAITGRDLGREYIKAIHKAVDAEFSKVTMDLRPVTLTGNTGKIPVEIRNNSSYKLDLILEAQSRELEFPDGPEQRISLEPGSEVTVIPVKVTGGGSQRVRLTLRAGDKAVAVKFATVTGTSFITAAIWTGAVGILALIGFFGFKFLRKRPKRLQRRSGGTV